jgi:hypothetical protein
MRYEKIKNTAGPIMQKRITLVAKYEMPNS